MDQIARTSMEDNPPRFLDRVAVIASGPKGIGRACALRFAREGARVAVLDILPGEAQTVASEIEALGQHALALHCDVRDRDQVSAAVARIVDGWGRIDVWVNNAGIFYVHDVADEPDMAKWDRILAVNLTGAFLCCQAAAKPMMALGSGSIFNVSSIAGKIAFPEEAGCCGTKTGVLGLTPSLAVELAPHGIRVNAICPGNILTPMLESVDARICAEEGWEPGTHLKKTAEEVPLGYIGEPEDVAAGAAFLASEDASYIVGQAINPDGSLVLY